MRGFVSLHPVAGLIYFVSTIGFACYLMHPVFLAISFVSAVAVSLAIKGRHSYKSTFTLVFSTIALMAVINPIVNHRGETILFYLSTSNPFTLESAVYGVCAGVMIGAVLCLFLSFNDCFTGDKLTYLFGRIAPSLALVFSMTLRFVPAFTMQMKKVVNAHRGMGRDIRKGSIVHRMRLALDILSSTLGWSMENAIETADSMRSRGFGLGKRTAYSIFTLTSRDRCVMLYMVVLIVYILTAIISGVTDFEYFPGIDNWRLNAYGLSVAVCYGLLCALPVILEIKEGIEWKYLQSKI